MASPYGVCGEVQTRLLRATGALRWERAATCITGRSHPIACRPGHAVRAARSPAAHGDRERVRCADSGRSPEPSVTARSNPEQQINHNARTCSARGAPAFHGRRQEPSGQDVSAWGTWKTAGRSGPQAAAEPGLSPGGTGGPQLVANSCPRGVIGPDAGRLPPAPVMLMSRSAALLNMAVASLISR